MEFGARDRSSLWFTRKTTLVGTRCRPNRLNTYRLNVYIVLSSHSNLKSRSKFYLSLSIGYCLPFKRINRITCKIFVSVALLIHFVALFRGKTFTKSTTEQLRGRNSTDHP